MTEISYFWDGVTTGDASIAPYNSNEFISYFRNLLNNKADKFGFVSGQGSNLTVSGTGQTVTVSAGMAQVDGTPYESSASVDVAIPIPVSSTRVDTVVLQKISAVNQTVRVARVAGVEGGSAPTLTQVSGGQYEYPLVDVSITTGGVMTLTDRRLPSNARIIQPQLLLRRGKYFTGPSQITTIIIPGGLLGTNGSLITGIYSPSTSFDVTITYGGSNVAISTPNIRKTLCLLKGNGATNSQRWIKFTWDANPSLQAATGTVAVDSTVNQSYAITLNASISALRTVYFPPTL